jgi:hypothetical protein
MGMASHSWCEVGQNLQASFVGPVVEDGFQEVIRSYSIRQYVALDIIYSENKGEGTYL